MRSKPSEKLEASRQVALELEIFGMTGAGTMNGYFAFRHKGEVIRIMASDASEPESCGWEHVSVSLRHRCPTWDEMAFVKDLFWDADEAVMQIHPPASDYVNNYETCLHLWKPTLCSIPMPPSILVGSQEEGVIRNRQQAEAAMRRVKERLLK